MTIGASRPLAPCTVITRTSSRAISMSRFTSVEAVRAAVDMVELVGGPPQLRKAGARYTARCPFHEERTPSFSVSPDRGYYCFGCGKGGDVVRFVQETESLDFVGAIEFLADRFRVTLEYEETSPEAEKARAAARKSSVS